MRKKEFLIKGAKSEEDALATLQRKIGEHVAKRKFRWLIPPETRKYETYWAYARIEFLNDR